MQEIKMEVEVEVGEQGLSVSGQIIPKFLKRTGVEEKLYPEKRGLKMRQGTGLQCVSWGYIFK